MYFLVITKRNENFDPGQLPAHKAFMARLKESGQVYISGPFGGPAGGGGYLLRADTLARAAEIALADPLHLSGSSTITVTQWDVTILG
jgi:uncharacterized protein YciI